MRETHKGIYCSGKAKSEEIEHSNQDLDERKKDLEAKKSELEEIVSETKQEEEKLREKAKVLETTIEPRLLQAFKRIRKILEMDWELCMFSVMHVVVVLTRFRPRNNLISVCVRKLSYVNIVVVS